MMEPANFKNRMTTIDNVPYQYRAIREVHETVTRENPVSFVFAEDVHSRTLTLEFLSCT